VEEMQSLSWSVPEYNPRFHSNDWYWGIGLVTLVVVIVAVVYGNILFGALLIIGVGSLLYFTAREPQLLTITLSARGLRVNDTLFVYSKITAFWIEEEDTIQEDHDRHLLLMTDRRIFPLLAIPIGDTPPEEIKARLLPHIEEREMAESKTHQLFEILGF
jgi:hypothetical protein